MNLAELRALVGAVPVDELPTIVAELAGLQALALVRIGSAHGGPRSGDTPPRRQTASEVADALGVEASAIYDWARKGRIPSERYGRFVRFELAEVRAALNSKRGSLGTRKKPRANGHLSDPPTARLPDRGAQ